MNPVPYDLANTLTRFGQSLLSKDQIPQDRRLPFNFVLPEASGLGVWGQGPQGPTNLARPGQVFHRLPLAWPGAIG